MSKIRMSSSGALATALALGLWIAAAPALAQSPDQRIVELERKLERSLEVIDQLSRRIKAIEQPATRRNDVPEGHGARIEAVEQQVSQMVSASAFRRGDDSGIPIHGFADVGLGVAGGAARKGFTVGSLDLYLTPQLGERTRALIELVAEVGPDGNTAVDLERAQLGYAFGDSATAWIGRFHTPYGYYNAAFHHGQQIATSLRRPRFLEFGQVCDRLAGRGDHWNSSNGAGQASSPAHGIRRMDKCCFRDHCHAGRSFLRLLFFRCKRGIPYRHRLAA